MASSRNHTMRNSRSRIPFVIKRIPIADPAPELLVPAAFRCPISLDLMMDPVTLHTGITYDRHSIESWLETGHHTCPVTNQSLRDQELLPNHTLRRMIQDWCVANRSLGVERIPTPKIPVSATQASNLLSEIALAGCRGDHARCAELVKRLKSLAKESERNKRCFVASRAARVLSALSGKFDNNGVLEEILSALTAFLPLDQESCRQLASVKSLDSILAVVNSGDFDARLNAVLLLKELDSAALLERIDDGLIEALAKLIERPISPRATKAALVAASHLVSSNDKVAATFAEMGIVPVLLEMIVDADKSLCEKALAVLDGVLSSDRGREMAHGHGLTVPVLVKKMFRVSNLATEFAVSALWKLYKNDNVGERSMEALQVGAFQKLLLLLQVGCSRATKEKVSGLLKVLNRHRGSLECTESVDFRGLKRPL